MFWFFGPYSFETCFSHVFSSIITKVIIFFEDSEEYIITLFSSQSEKITARENTKEEIVFFQKIFCFHVMQYIPRSRLKKIRCAFIAICTT